MPAPDSDITGLTRYRPALLSRALILQVEVRRIANWDGPCQPGVRRVPVYETAWRDARPFDLYVLGWIEQNSWSEGRAAVREAPDG